MTMKHQLISVACAMLLSGCVGGAAPRATAVPRGAVYVAMGSSFAAGPGVSAAADSPPNRCARSADNYAHQLAKLRGLTLIDVSCSGATTAHLLGPWNDLAPQLNALTPETRLVTITIGGNDVGFIGNLMATSCRETGGGADAPGGKCPDTTVSSEAQWQTLAAGMKATVREARHRAPLARLILIDYPVILPADATCAAVPLSASQAEAARTTARRLADLTAQVAKEEGATLVQASRLSEGHDACSANPWINGFPRRGGPRFVPYHPNLAGMSAVAQELNRVLS